MTSLQYTLFCAVMGALAAQPLFANVSGWLSPNATHDSPYTFLNKAGTTITLPSADYAGWKVFNATSSNAEQPQDYAISSADDDDNVGDGMHLAGDGGGGAGRGSVACDGNCVGACQPTGRGGG